MQVVVMRILAVIAGQHLSRSTGKTAYPGSEPASATRAATKPRRFQARLTVGLVCGRIKQIIFVSEQAMNSVTTIVITDPKLLDELAAAIGQIVFQTADGRHVRTVEPIALGTPAAFHCPFTDEELDELSKERSGRPLAAILEDLSKKYGE